jgi:hypothetical protein
MPPPRFRPGAAAYAKDGRRYTVDEVADGIVYCASPNGAETEFPEAQLMTEAEWAASSGGKRDSAHDAVKQSRAFTPYKGPLDRAGAEALLAKAERLFPGILDFTAFNAASRAAADAGSQGAAADLSIVKCRAIFDAATPQTRAALLAGIMGIAPDRAVSAAGLGDNLLRAMIDKGLAAASVSYETFRSRRRQ